MFQFALLHKQLVQMQHAAAAASNQSASSSTANSGPAPPPLLSPLTIASSTVPVPQLPTLEKVTAGSKLPPQLLNLTPQPPSALFNPAMQPPGNVVSSNDNLMATTSLPVAPPPITGQTSSMAHTNQTKCTEKFLSYLEDIDFLLIISKYNTVL